MDFLQLIYFGVITRLPLSFIPARYKNSKNVHLRETAGFVHMCFFKNTIPSPYLPLHRIPCEANKPGFRQALEGKTRTRSAQARAPVIDQ